MQIIDVQQGTKLWHDHRAKHRNASDTPSVTGHSPYKSRGKFMHERKYGIIPDVDDATQHRFDQGHRSEALARPLMENIIGEELYPVTGVDGVWSASFDGLTMAENICAEHKALNDTLRAVKSSEELPIYYREQMEHQLRVCGGEKCLFMASAWNDDTLAEEVHFWYFPDDSLWANIQAAWDLFDKELETYEHQEFIPAPKAEAIMALPAVIINVTGQLAACNLNEVTPRFDKFLSEAKTTLVTDDDFVNGEETAKFSRTTAKTLKLKADEVISQIASIGEATNTLKLYAEKFDALGLKLEKLVKSEKENRKSQIVMGAEKEFSSHIASLDAEIKPMKLSGSFPDFASAIKGKKRLDAMQESVNTMLREAKIAADAQAKEIRAKLTWCKETSAGFGFLFNDLAQIIAKPMDDFQLIITTRIKEHKQAEAEKEEATRKRIQAEEQAKAEAKAKAEQEAILAAERAKIESDARAKEKAEIAVELERIQREDDERQRIEREKITAKQKEIDDFKSALIAESDKMRGKAITEPKKISESPKISAKEVIKCLQDIYGITHGDACDLIISIAEELKLETER